MCRTVVLQYSKFVNGLEGKVKFFATKAPDGFLFKVMTIIYYKGECVNLISLKDIRRAER